MDTTPSEDGEPVDFIRANGDCLCPVCGRPYLRHPFDPKVLDWNGEPWLNVLCDGLRVKL